MDYFTLIPDKVCPLVRICNHTDPKILQVVRLKEMPCSGMLDIIFQPIFLVSQLFYQCIQIYHPYAAAAKIRLAGLRNGFTYYIPELPSADEKEAFSLYKRHIYKTTDCGVETVEVSLDLSESLLRRGAWGFGLKART